MENDCSERQASQQGMERLFAPFFKQHSGVVSRFLRGRTGNAHDAEDLTQETFLRAYAAFSNPQTEPSLAWILQIANRVWQNWLRDKSAAKRTPNPTAPGGMSSLTPVPAFEAAQSAQPDPLSQLLSKQSLRSVHEALEDLPPQMRRCFSMHVFLGHKYKDIAFLLDISIDTVKSNISRARARINETCRVGG